MLHSEMTIYVEEKQDSATDLDDGEGLLVVAFLGSSNLRVGKGTSSCCEDCLV